MGRQAVNSDARKISRGHLKWRVIRDIAAGDGDTVLAERYGCTRRALQEFKKNYPAEIEDLRKSIADEFTGLWVSDKFNRIAEYQQTIEDVNATLDQLLSLGTTLGPQDMAMIKEKRALLRNVAEELGQLPNRNNVNVSAPAVIYEFNGVDPGDMT